MRLFVCVYVYVIIYALFSDEDVQHENEEHSPNVF